MQPVLIIEPNRETMTDDSNSYQGRRSGRGDQTQEPRARRRGPIQSAGGPRQSELNAFAVRQRLQQAVKEGANLIVLPELATTGYCFHSREEAFAHAEPVPDGQTVRGWIAFAKEKQVYLVGCLPEADGHQLFDTAVLVGPRPGLSESIRKTHLWNEEKLFFTPGNLGFPVFDRRESVDPVAGVLGHRVSRDRSYRQSAGRRYHLHSQGWVWTPPPLYDASGTCMAACLHHDGRTRKVVFISRQRTGSAPSVVKDSMGNSLIAAPMDGQSAVSPVPMRIQSYMAISISFRRAPLRSGMSRTISSGIGAPIFTISCWDLKAPSVPR